MQLQGIIGDAQTLKLFFERLKEGNHAISIVPVDSYPCNIVDSREEFVILKGRSDKELIHPYGAVINYKVDLGD